MFFDNLFNSTTLIQKLHDNRLYVLGPARSDRIAADEKGQRNETRKLLMQILKPHSLYQMIWQQVHDATQKLFERNNIYIDRLKKIEGSFI